MTTVWNNKLKDGYFWEYNFPIQYNEIGVNYNVIGSAINWENQERS